MHATKTRGPRVRSRVAMMIAVIVVLAGVSLVTYTLRAPSAGASSKPVVVTASSQRFSNPVAISVHGKYLWIVDDSGGTAHHGELYRVAIATGQTTPIPSPLFDEPMWVYTDGTDVWTANMNNDSATGALLEVNVATDHVSRLSAKGINGPLGMTSTGKYLWILNDGSTLTRLNTATGATTTNTATVTAGENSIASDQRYVWLTGARLLRISEATSQIKVIDPNEFTDTSQVLSNGTDILIRSGNRHIFEIDIATGKILKSFYNPQFEFSLNMTTNWHDVWMSDNEQSSVLQLDLATGTVTSITSPSFSHVKGLTPWSVSAKGSTVWVSVLCSRFVNGVVPICGTVQKINP